ncbi:nucleoside triphosphate pyrophosphohydrolase [Terribacillus saccharophilus]|uniref:Predicted house-cleaning noncanonical NTP pyrophosphatase, all-alpha NTP-PPase (MazG) superfamily n=1 Tax=Terribacillus saccharophilus TaxID=361277 RepID=A0AAX2EGS0_9BACI|nr:MULTISPECIES: nucleoside triphosphate pyrophosphohydrolase [Terribacillus]MCM3225656.1 nucleoside triphosphate pyrophosphohydrolase [Terribacillus saccharophilus]SEN46614.1 Predicted house-cleaning noncanonical NTP pyrophosphatase, all-alpha NTP-PPase (MazG) superfamily [Terribacillus saccharophilus]
MPTYNKLVRDRIPTIIQQAGKAPKTRVLDEDRYVEELKLKLLEEANEILKAEEHNEVVEEAADLLEVLHALLEAKGIALKDIELVRQQKREERGGFEDRVFLIEVNE